jgi:GNAT superfamily N-acetyltransferase
MKSELRAPVSATDWAAYHDIRRRVLFELRGRGPAYDPNHPDEHRPGHFPLILWCDESAVGVIRVDVEANVAIFRRVAIREDLQRRGHGRTLLQLAEHFAKDYACTRIDSYVDAPAVGFYSRCGFARAARQERESSAVLMTKPIS